MESPERRNKASTNDWYCLATIHGEPNLRSIDQYIENKNRECWNKISINIPNITNKFLLDFLVDHPISPPTEGELAYSRKLFDERGGTRFPIMEDGCIINFDSLQFERPARFKGYIFRETVTFKKCAFEYDIDLSKAIFLKDVIIDRCIASEGLRLNNTIILGELRIIDSDFGGDVNADSCRVYGRTKIEFDKFERTVNFNSSTFMGDVSFRNSEFNDATKFNKVTFGTYVPDFRGAKMHDATEMHGITWPEPPKTKKEKIATALEYVDRYSRLKQEMDRLKKSEDRLFFFRKELKARQYLYDGNKGRTFYYINHAYEKISKYGDSVIFPVRYLSLLVLIGFFPVYYGYKVPHRCELSAWDRSLIALKISVSNSIPLNPHKSHLLRAEIFDDQNISLQTFLILQSISGALLVFLMVLALRNRFGVR